MDVKPRIDAYFKGPAFTLWTFIKYHERSGDPAHAKRLKRAMTREIYNLMAQGLVSRCRSLRGKVAYRWRTR